MDSNGVAVNKEIERIVDYCVRCKMCSTFCPPLVATGISMETFVQFHLMSPTSEEEFVKYLSLCLACRRCVLECPAGIDMGALVLEGRRRQVSRSGQSVGDRVLARLDLVSKLASRTAPLSNVLIQWRPARLLAEQILGLQSSYALPQFQRRHLRTRQLALNSPDTRNVAFFTGCYLNYADGEGVGQVVVDLLEERGCRVVIPDQVCTGVARIAYGDQVGALQNLEYNVNSLGTWVDRGYDIVTACSSCHFALRHEYPRLVPHDKVRKIADITWDLFEYMSMVNGAGRSETEPAEVMLKVVSHSSCHARAARVDRYVVEVLSTIPGLKVTTVDDGCCGMGGTFGMKVVNYDLITTIGKQTAARIAAKEPNVVVSACPACRMQLSQLLDGVPCIHPALLLSRSYRQDLAGALAPSR